MNYARVYAEFIRDRLAKQPSDLEYFEVHHIRPRCMGGGNEASNLIRLTPEDHFFAHVLLAVAHGGMLWSAVFLMSERHSFRDAIRRRAIYGRAKREWSKLVRGREGLKGSENGNHNPTEYRWRHLDTGERRVSTLSEMWRIYGGTRAIWTSAVTPGSGKPSALGWALDDGKARLRSSKGKVFTFVNRDGRTFTGTQSEFCRFASVSLASGTRVVRYESVTVCGWRLEGVKDRSHFADKVTGLPVRLDRGKTFIAEKDGVVVQGPRRKVAEALGVAVGRFNSGVDQIACGQMKTYKGWRVKWQENLFCRELLGT